MDYDPDAAVVAEKQFLKSKILELESEVIEINQVFDIQYKADQKAIKLWQEAHPDKSNIWPDRCDMVLWLMNELEKYKIENAKLKEDLLFSTRVCSECGGPAVGRDFIHYENCSL